jgi:MtrB/PioB family decaheme-associated outer membrane protein
MKTVRQIVLRPTAMAIALLAAFAQAQAQTSEAKPGEAKSSDVRASVSVGGAWVSGDAADRAIFGQYNGLRDRDAYGLLGFDYDRRNEATGTWVQMQGVDLGLDTRELNFLWKRQGNWQVSADYGELVRRELYTVNTGLAGAGGVTPQVVYLGNGAGSGASFDPKTRRKGLGIGLSKWFGPGLQFDVSVRSENKEGSRLFGIGMNCQSIVAPDCGSTALASTGTAVLLLPEPIKSNHSQVEARLAYAGERLRLSGGYYGSLYNNEYATMAPAIPGSLNNPLGSPLPLAAGLQGILSNPVALPPDNQAHHFDVTGNVTITPTTRANFKLAYSQATQDQAFAGTGLAGAPAGVASLDGKVDTTMAQVGISSRPIARLTLLAEARYEDRKDKTPIALYNAQGAATYTNRDYSNEKIRGKLQATYQISGNYSASVGADYESIDRAAFTPTSAVAGVSALRLETEETSFRAELRRRMTETFSFSAGYIYSDRDGSNWLRPAAPGVVEVTDPAAGFSSTAIFSPTLADRRRDKVRLMAMWQASDALSIQFSAEDGKDKYSAPTRYALQKTRMDLYSVDVSYAVSEAWNASAYASRGTQKLNQARPAGSIIAYDNTSTNFGVGVNGRLGGKFELGGGLSYVNDKSEYAQTLDEFASPAAAALLAATGGLPDIVFRRTELKLFGKYLLGKSSSLRLDAIHQRARFNDWGYQFNGVPYLFSDNTTLSLQQVQNVTFVGLTYTYAWP